MRLHPRHAIVTQADLELRQAISEIEHRHKLTCAELVSLLAEHIERTCRTVIRSERDTDSPDTPGDEEG